ncbi:MAG: tetratricopeptide repeat protein [Granulosicoccus sp.]
MQFNDLVWFLLPVAATGGWFAAKRSLNRQKEEFWDSSHRFHNELKELLTAKESSARILDSFSDGDRDAVETHIALGNLYRRRGDINRAIVIHESVAEKQNLSTELTAQAQYELARDYDSAGLLDRSEAAYKKVIASGALLDDAYSGLLQLYELQLEWQQAIDLALQYVPTSSQSLAKPVAHYYCELSLLAMENGEFSAAQNHLSKALKYWPQCHRAHIILAQLALAEGNYARCVQLYAKVESLRPELMPEIIDNWFEALHGLGDESLLDKFIMRIRSQRNAYSVIRKTRQVIADLKGENVAEQFFKEQILRRPSLRGLRDWLHDQLESKATAERDKVKVICNLLDQVMEDKPAYRCEACGFQGSVMHWRCPGCHAWDTVSTIIGVEGE